MPTSETHAQNPDEVIDLLADIVSGLQAPASMIGRSLGAAYDPWAKLHNRIGFGWHSPEEVRAWLHEVLQ